MTHGQVDQFDRDGALILRNAIPAQWIERMRAAVDRILAAPTAFSADLTSGSGGRFFGDYFIWRNDEDFRAFIFKSPIAQIARRTFRSRKVNFFYEQLLVKEPGTEARTPWHQDMPYWCVGGLQVASIWVPFDRATPDNGVDTYVKGSHLWGKLFRPRGFGNLPRGDAETAGLEDAPDIAPGHKTSSL